MGTKYRPTATLLTPSPMLSTIPPPVGRHPQGSRRKDGKLWTTRGCCCTCFDCTRPGKPHATPGRASAAQTPGAQSTFVTEDGGKDALGVATPECVRVRVTQCARNQLDPHLPRLGRIHLRIGGAPLGTQAEAKGKGEREGERKQGRGGRPERQGRGGRPERGDAAGSCRDHLHHKRLLRPVRHRRFASDYAIHIKRFFLVAKINKVFFFSETPI